MQTPNDVAQHYAETKLKADKEVEIYGEIKKNTKCSLEILETLTAHVGMRDVWDKLVNFPDIRGVSAPVSFTKLVCLAYIGPLFPAQKRPPGELNTWADKVLEKTQELIDLIKDTDLDYFHIYERRSNLSQELLSHYLKKEQHTKDKCSYCDEWNEEWKELWLQQERRGRSAFTETLGAFAELVPEMIDTWPLAKFKKIYLKKPNDPKARRAYFIVFLTQFFEDDYGHLESHVRLQENIIHTTTNAVFHNDNIDIKNFRALIANNL